MEENKIRIDKIKNITHEKSEEVNILDLPELITRSILDFRYDEIKERWITKIGNGKVAILHRNSTWIPQSGIRYNCSIDEKSGYALAWITGFADYPRIIIKADRSCVVIFDPIRETESEEYSNIYLALESNKLKDLEFIFTMYRKENKEKAQDIPTREVKVEMKVKEGDKTIQKTSKIEVGESTTAKDILSTLNNFMNSW